MKSPALSAPIANRRIVRRARALLRKLRADRRGLAAVEFALVLPVMLVAQLFAPYTTVEERVATGATPLMPPICPAIASASATLKRGAAEPSRIGPSCWPGRMMIRLLPRLPI